MSSIPPTPTLGYILKGYPRISETFISNEILLLEKLGFTMRLFPMRQPRESFSHASVKQIQAQVDYLPTELLPHFYRLLIPNIFLAVKRPAAFKKAVNTAKAGVSPGNTLATLKHLLQAGYMTNYFLLRDQNIRQLHGHFAHSPTSVTLFASILANIPYSFTAHAKDIYTSKKEKLRRKIKHANFVVTCTQHNREYLQALAKDIPTPIYCIYHGIDIQLFKRQVEHKEPEQPYKLFTVARMTEKKGLPTIYRALALLKERGINFRHCLIGDGDDKEAIHRLVSTLGLSKQCKLLGTQNHDQVLSQFNESDLFVLGCQIAQNGDRDGIPNVLVESLAMGVPAISTNVSAIPEILINGTTGITVPPEDPVAMASEMVKALTDVPYRNQLINNGREFVEDKFDNTKWIKELATIFTQHNKYFR